MLGGNLGSPEWKFEGIRVDNPDGNFFITESNYEGIKEGPLLRFNYTIIGGDVLWVTVGYPEWKFEGIRVDNPDVNSKIFPVVTSDGEPIGLIDKTMLGIDDSSQLGKELGFGISEQTSEGIKEGPLLVLKDNIIDGRRLWTAERIKNPLYWPDHSR